MTVTLSCICSIKSEMLRLNYSSRFANVYCIFSGIMSTFQSELLFKSIPIHISCVYTEIYCYSNLFCLICAVITGKCIYLLNLQLGNLPCRYSNTYIQSELGFLMSTPNQLPFNLMSTKEVSDFYSISVVIHQPLVRTKNGSHFLW